jgi:hypothetical protein
MKKYFRLLTLTLVMVLALGSISVFAYTVTNTRIYGSGISVDQDGIEYKAVSKPGYNKISGDILLENATTKGSSNAICYAYFGMEYKFDSGLVWNEFYKRWNACVSITPSFSATGEGQFFASTDPGRGVGDGYTTFLDTAKPYIPQGHNAYILSDAATSGTLTYTLYDKGTTAVPEWRKVWVISIPVKALTGTERMTEMATMVLLGDTYAGTYNKGVTFDRVNVYKGTAQSLFTTYGTGTIYGIAKGTTTNTTVTYQDLSSSTSTFNKVKIDINCP